MKPKNPAGILILQIANTRAKKLKYKLLKGGKPIINPKQNPNDIRLGDVVDFNTLRHLDIIFNIV